MGLVDQLHQAGIGVILDWVPSHFPTDPTAWPSSTAPPLRARRPPDGLSPRLEQPDLQLRPPRGARLPRVVGRAVLGTYHADALRVDAVASMLYRDYSRKAGEWLPNEHGGRENLEASPSSASSMPASTRTTRRPDHRRGVDGVARRLAPTDVGGLGFGLKWDMGWMHDTLEYFAQDPIYRRYHHGELTFDRSMPSPRTSSCRSPTTRSSTARAPCSTRCPATNGSSSPASGSSTATSTRFPARSCSSRATSWARAPSGTTTRASTGGCSRTGRTRGSPDGWAT